MTGQPNKDPIAEFCAGLRRLQEGCGLDRAALARRLGYSRSQLYAILGGQISRPPGWSRMVEPLVRVCTGNDERAIDEWRRRHEVLVEIYHALQHQTRQDTPPKLARVVPAQLPADVDRFTGRVRELAELNHALAGTAKQTNAVGGESTAVAISMISGTAGVGKTALALRWAHRVRGDYPDGQLYVNLRGYDSEQPMSAGDALAAFLRSLGLAGSEIPLEIDERAAVYRSLLNGRRILVVLDNAATVGQIRPLLPGIASCLVVVTSRDSLAGLVARDGARRLDLDPLPPEDAVTLLRALIGRRIDTEPGAAATLAEQCARLPLALRVAAELAAARPGASLAELVTELSDEHRRLELFDAGGDPRTAVRGVFSWSYRHLPSDAARMFRLIGLHPGTDFDVYAAATLANISLKRAQQLLDLLTRTHLIQLTRSSRYGMHDLLRAYATYLAAEEEPEQERRAALTRLFDHYLSTTAAAMDTLVPAPQDRPPPPTRSDATPSPLLADPTTARAWLDAERATLTTVTTYTAAHGWPGHATRLATTLYCYLETGGHYLDALSILTHARHAARQTSDPSAEARALTNLGLVYFWQGHYQEATAHHQQALALCREIDDRAGEADALTRLGLVYQQQGSYQQATEHHQQALALFREIGHRDGEANVLDDIGVAYWHQGHYGQAAEHLERALALFREIGHRVGEAHALGYLGLIHQRQGRYGQAAEHLECALALFHEIGHRIGEARALAPLGDVYQHQGRYAEAIEHLERALVLFREVGDRGGEADALALLGGVYQRQGHYEQADDHQQQALALYREIGYPTGEARALNNLGEIRHATGQLREAHIRHTAALALARHIGDRYEQARAHNGLAHAHPATSDSDLACYHWQEALTLYSELGVPDADDIRTHLPLLDRAEADKGSSKCPRSGCGPDSAGRSLPG
ncbi:MAG TPA: tetratricopeptide repeat protein [Pseudonocardiaceae bacterium]|nr:tetratricopeptide repeat protein [Pseudonocardiaceae bacterium]